MRLLHALVTAAALGSCATPTVLQTTVSCVVTAAATPTSGLPGDAVTLAGGPFTETFDTLVRMDGVEAPVTAVSREGCALCDACRSANVCPACGTCTACADACSACVQQVQVTVPDLSPGDVSVVLFNRYGGTAPLSFEVLAAPGDSDADTDGVPDSPP